MSTQTARSRIMLLMFAPAILVPSTFWSLWFGVAQWGWALALTVGYVTLIALLFLTGAGQPISLQRRSTSGADNRPEQVTKAERDAAERRYSWVDRFLVTPLVLAPMLLAALAYSLSDWFLLVGSLVAYVFVGLFLLGVYVSYSVRHRRRSEERGG